MRFRKQRRNCALLALASLFALVVVVLGTPMFRTNPARASIRGCFSNQKTLMGAIAMMALDRGERYTDLTPELLSQLIENEYLRSPPRDPGMDQGSERNYLLVRLPGTRYDEMIACLEHGFIQPPEGFEVGSSGVEQLRHLGIEPGRKPVGPEGTSWFTGNSPFRGFSLTLDAIYPILGILGVLGLGLGSLLYLGYGVAEVVMHRSRGSDPFTDSESTEDE